MNIIKKVHMYMKSSNIVYLNVYFNFIKKRGGGYSVKKIKSLGFLSYYTFNYSKKVSYVRNKYVNYIFTKNDCFYVKHDIKYF